MSYINNVKRLRVLLELIETSDVRPRFNRHTGGAASHDLAEVKQESRRKDLKLRFSKPLKI